MTGAMRDGFDNISFTQAIAGIDLRALEAYARKRSTEGRVSARIVSLAFDVAHEMVAGKFGSVTAEDARDTVLSSQIEADRNHQERRTITDILRSITVGGFAEAGERYPLLKERLAAQQLAAQAPGSDRATDHTIVTRRRALGWGMQLLPLPFAIGALAGNVSQPRLGATLGGASVSAVAGAGLRVSATDIERFNRLLAQVDKRYLDANPNAALSR